jgi:hypothetical protein
VSTVKLENVGEMLLSDDLRLSIHRQEPRPLCGSLSLGIVRFFSMRTLSAAVVLFATVFGAAGSSNAAVNGAETLEWLTCSSEIVAVGRLASVSAVKDPKRADIYDECVVTVTQSIISGAHNRELTFSVRRSQLNPVEWLSGKDELLVLLVTNRPSDAGVYPYYEEHLDNVLVPRAVYPLSVTALSGSARAFDGHCRRITTPKSLLRIVRSTAIALGERRRRDPGFTPSSHWLSVLEDTDAWDELYLRSACYLVVPTFMFPEPKPWRLSRREAILAASFWLGGMCAGGLIIGICYARQRA